MKGIFTLLFLMLLVVGCNSSYTDYKHDCLYYIQNCTVEGGFCIPDKCNTNHTCNTDDIKLCSERFINGVK